MGTSSQGLCLQPENLPSLDKEGCPEGAGGFDQIQPTTSDMPGRTGDPPPRLPAPLLSRLVFIHNFWLPCWVLSCYALSTLPPKPMRLHGRLPDRRLEKRATCCFTV